MAWALYGAGKAGAPNRAVRLHLSLNILEDQPQYAAVRPGAHCERKVWREQWVAGQAYVGDRCFGQEYKLFGQLQAKGCAFVLRLREQQTVIHPEPELEVSPADQQAGVLRQAWARLGAPSAERAGAGGLDSDPGPLPSDPGDQSNPGAAAGTIGL